MESSVRILTEEEIKKADFDKGIVSVGVPLSRERQEEIKELMFSALKDPRASYRKVDMDDIVKDWDNLKNGC